MSNRVEIRVRNVGRENDPGRVNGSMNFSERMSSAHRSRKIR